jgi:predicted lipoprotein with Yx(FWY)xxD motif
MTRSRLINFLSIAAMLPLIALAAGCGGGGGAGGSTTSTTAPKTASGGTATVGVASTGLGKILVDFRGRTVYLFKKDAGTKSSCTGACASTWPPVRVTRKPTVGTGANASMVGTTKRSDGPPQVTYNGHPLYTYTGDQSAGETNGQGLTAFGAAWFALSPAGNQITKQSNSGSGGASGY